MPTRLAPRGLLMSLLGLCLACSGGGLNSATGKVTYKGDPIKGAIVIFHPKGADINSQRPCGDGSVQFLKESTAPGVLVALISASGGEVLQEN